MVTDTIVYTLIFNIIDLNIFLSQSGSPLEIFEESYWYDQEYWIKWSLSIIVVKVTTNIPELTLPNYCHCMVIKLYC